jgi:hypothetical protein
MDIWDMAKNALAKFFGLLLLIACFAVPFGLFLFFPVETACYLGILACAIVLTVCLILFLLEMRKNRKS